LTHAVGEAAGGMLQIQTLVIQFTSFLQPQLAAVEARDAKFADQLRRSLLSVGLNLGEGYGASGGAKRKAYRVALGEAAELEMGLEMAAALGYCSLGREQRETLQRILATLQKLARPHR
jgi:four helix bundle protein